MLGIVYYFLNRRFAIRNTRIKQTRVARKVHSTLKYDYNNLEIFDKRNYSPRKWSLHSSLQRHTYNKIIARRKRKRTKSDVRTKFSGRRAVVNKAITASTHNNLALHF
jgi:hypothetical protein